MSYRLVFLEPIIYSVFLVIIRHCKGRSDKRISGDWGRGEEGGGESKRLWENGRRSN